MNKKAFIVLLSSFLLFSCGTPSAEASSNSKEVNEKYSISTLEDYLVYCDSLSNANNMDNPNFLFQKNIKIVCETTKDFSTIEYDDGIVIQPDFEPSTDIYQYKDGNYYAKIISNGIVAVNYPYDYFFTQKQTFTVAGFFDTKRKYVSVNEERKLFNTYPDFYETQNESLTKVYYDITEENLKEYGKDENVEQYYYSYSSFDFIINNSFNVLALNCESSYILSPDHDRSVFKNFTTREDEDNIYFSYQIESLNDTSYGEVKDIYSTVEGTIDRNTMLFNASIDYKVNSNNELWQEKKVNINVTVNEDDIVFEPTDEYEESIDAISY